MTFRAIIDQLDTLPVKKYAVITATKQALAFREQIVLTGNPENRMRANALMREAMSLLLRCREIPFYVKFEYIPFICSANLYTIYKRKR